MALVELMVLKILSFYNSINITKRSNRSHWSLGCPKNCAFWPPLCAELGSIMAMFLEIVESELAKHTITLSILSYLFYMIIKFWLDKETKSFQNELERKFEEYEHKLEKERIKFQIAYGGIFEQQAKALLDIHKSLISLQKEAEMSMAFPPEDRERKLKFRKAWRDIREKYRECRALLPEEVDVSTKEFLEKILNGVNLFHKTEKRLCRSPTEEEQEKLFEEQDSALKIIYEEAPELVEKIIGLTRVHVGVSNVL